MKFFDGIECSPKIHRQHYNTFLYKQDTHIATNVQYSTSTLILTLNIKNRQKYKITQTDTHAYGYTHEQKKNAHTNRTKYSAFKSFPENCSPLFFFGDLYASGELCKQKKKYLVNYSEISRGILVFPSPYLILIV